MKQIIVTILVLSIRLLGGQTFAQDTTTSDFFTQIKNYDLSVVMTADSIFANEEKMIKRSEILGFIGDNYQRLHIHFISIIQNPSNPYEYFAYGKTKVKESICSFQGTITVTKSRLYKESDIPVDKDGLPHYKQGYAECEVNLYEDSKQKSAGFFFGKLKMGFLIDDKGQFRYDAISYVADEFCNNQFVGSWTSYGTKSTKKSNWGDYRIPESGNLDIGVGEFSVDEKYVKNGWENYRLAWSTYPETQEVINAKQKEKEEWWK